ncbi:MAG: RNA polymerase sigma factor region1.1 domain-containing protein, partial [Verrucomicrobiota bacterium]
MAAHPKPRAESAAVKPLPTITQNGFDPALSEKIKELVRLAQEQGHLTYTDLNEVLPDNAVTPEILDEVFSKLRTLEIEIV